MILPPKDAERMDALVRDLQAEGQPLAIATVVRTQGTTAAKAGARAVLSAEGALLQGWIGGGCARGAVRRAAQQALATDGPVYVALRPEEALSAAGIAPRETRDGTVYERNGCPSKGSMDIFIEPVRPAPTLAILGDGPVAVALSTLGRGLDLELANALTDGACPTYVVVATQGQNDRATLAAALQSDARYVAFVGSRRKFAALRATLAAAGADAARLDAVHAPAGLDIGAATAEEIALSILAEITLIRRKGRA